MSIERNEGLHDAQHFNPGNVLMGDDIEPSNVVMGDEVEASNVVMGDDSRARISSWLVKGNSGWAIGADSSLSLASGGGHAHGPRAGPWRPPCGGTDCFKNGGCLHHEWCPAERLGKSNEDGWPSR
jgi:hypothetical protein